MIKRPLCIGAVLLVVVLLLGNWLGVPKEAPLFSEDVLYSENGGRQVQVLGRVNKREITARGTRLYLNQISFLNDNSNSKNIPYLNETKYDWQVLVYMKSNTKDFPYIGSRVVVEGKCELPEAASNPGQFDARQYYLLRKVAMFLYDGIILQ